MGELKKYLNFDFSFLKSHAINFILALVLLFVAVRKTPSILEMYKTEGTLAHSATVIDLNSQVIAIPLVKKHILVFWATWCGPCKVELGRINKMIQNGEIDAESILAISVAEDLNLVTSVVKDQRYLFKVALDQRGQAAELYRVSGTPTLLFIDNDQKIYWMTTGISPSLEFRIRSFLK